MEAKHTPGPWENSHGTIMAAAGKVAEAGNPGYGGFAAESEGEAIANARLIAAAPAMLGALQDLVEDFGAMTGGSESLDVARAILKHLGVES